MIARTWHGMTPAAKADAYLDFLKQRALPDYRRIPGNLGAWILRREEGERTHFTTLTFWESREAIAAFAGDDISLAKYYPEDRDFLLEFEPQVQHHELFG
jgi:heme-degrading monooxygenase HmoA